MKENYSFSINPVTICHDLALAYASEMLSRTLIEDAVPTTPKDYLEPLISDYIDAYRYLSEPGNIPDSLTGN